MNRQPLNPLRAGDRQISAGNLNRAFEAIERHERLEAHPGLGVADGGGARVLYDLSPEWLEIEITSGSNPYAWTEKLRIGGTGQAQSDYATGERSGTAAGFPAIERNSYTSVPAGTIVWARVVPAGNCLEFSYFPRSKWGQVALNATQTAWDLSDYDEVTVVPGADGHLVHGITGGFNGRKVLLHNPTNYTFTLKNRSGDALAADQLVSVEDVVVPGNGWVVLVYFSSAAAAWSGWQVALLPLSDPTDLEPVNGSMAVWDSNNVLKSGGIADNSTTLTLGSLLRKLVFAQTNPSIASGAVTSWAIGKGIYYTPQSSGSSTVHGIAGGEIGRIIVVMPQDNALTFKHQSGSAAIGERITCATGADVTLAAARDHAILFCQPNLSSGGGHGWHLLPMSGLAPASSVYTDELAQDAVGSGFTNTASINATYDDGAGTYSWTVNDDSITFAKMQELNANTLIGASSAGNPVEISCTAAGRSLLDDADAAAQRTTLGGTTVGQFYYTLANPGAVTFPRMNADNTVSSLNAADFRTAIGAGTGTGDVVGPSSSFDNSIPRFDGTTGKLIQDSGGGVTIDDSGNLSVTANILLANNGLRLFDSDSSHRLIITMGSNLAADTALSIFMTSARSITLVGNLQLGGDLITDGASSLTLTTTGTTNVTLPTTGTLATRAGTETFTNKTLTTPTIGSFTNANHNHQDAAGGGALAAAAITSGSFAAARLQANSAKSAAFTAGTVPTTYDCTMGSSYTATLPAASGNAGLRLGFKVVSLTGSSVLTIDGSGSETIDGALTLTINYLWEYVEIECDGTNWIVVTADRHTGCRVSRTSNHSHNSSGSWQTIAFDAEEYDSDGFHSTVTNNTRITIPTGGDGIYVIGACADFDVNTTGERGLYILLNGTTTCALDIRKACATTTPVSLNFPLKMVAGDYIELNAYQNSGGTLAITNNTGSSYTIRFWVAKLKD